MLWEILVMGLSCASFGFTHIPHLYRVDHSASPLHPLLTRCDDKTFSRHCPVSLGGQKHLHLHHWLHADFTSTGYLVRTPDRRGSELCTGAVTAKRVNALLSSWSLGLAGKGSLQAVGRPWNRCYARVLAEVRGPLDLLLWGHVNLGRTQSLLSTSCYLDLLAPQISGDNEHSHLGIEGFCSTGSWGGGEMKSWV